MRCTRPRTVGFEADGKTICWSPKSFTKEYATFQLPCGKCIECRLDYARQWAIRCVHEAQMHPQNCFITLTYDDANLGDNKLDYTDFQKFMKKLRKLQNDPIGMFVTGEYGEKNKRKHWHAIIFNWAPKDAKPKYKTAQGHQVWESDTLTKLWGKGIAEFGSVTFDSAGYCARYAAKKLVHGKDEEHDYIPISKKSSKHAIGKKWLEQFWPDIFLHGVNILRDGTKTSIPRYYEKWFKQNHPGHWADYVTRTKQQIINTAQDSEKIKNDEWLAQLFARSYRHAKPLTRNQVKEIIQKQKFNLLHNHLKL